MTDTLAGPPILWPTAARGQSMKEFLGPAFFEIGPEQDEEQHVSGQHVGHDAENAVRFIEDACAQDRAGYRPHGPAYRACVRRTSHKKDHGAHDDKDVAHHAAGQLDADQNADHGHPLINQRFQPRCGS
jgi:hypothetical protein